MKETSYVNINFRKGIQLDSCKDRGLNRFLILKESYPNIELITPTDHTIMNITYNFTG